MRQRFPIFIVMAVAACGIMLPSCMKDSDNDYKDWRQTNEEWFAEKTAETDYYTVVRPSWNNSVYVLMHWYNDREATRGNLVPKYTSTVDVKYRGQLYDATPFDSSYLRTSPADSLFRVQVSGDVIEGWAVALTNMHVGDSCRVIIPYNLAYGAYSRGTYIKPYSMLVFDILLKGINNYETKY